VRLARPLCAAAVVFAAAAAGCGAAAGERGYAVPGRSLTVYSGAPLRGVDRPGAEDLVAAERLALAQARGRAGRWRVRLRVLDDSGLGAVRWNPAIVSQNARRAAGDPRTIAYLGGSSSGATAVALPLLNQAGILQVSPGAGAVALTRADSAFPGSPEKYYPNERSGRTFGRVVPSDSVEGAAIASWMARAGVRSAYLVDGGETDGTSVVSAVSARLRAHGIALAGSQSVAPGRADWGDVARAAASSRADALLFAGSAQAGAASMFAAARAVDSRLALFGSSQLAQPAVAARLGPGAEGARIASPALPAAALPASDRRFRAAFRRAYGREPQAGAAFGYEAMRVVLDAIRRAGEDGNRRRAVVRAFFATDRPRSVLGSYSIDRAGDSTLTAYAGYVVRRGRLVPVRLGAATEGA